MLKKIFVIVLAVISLLSCQTKFSINGEYEEMPIVHFLLDQGQEYHFLKLNRTFLKEGNALDFAKEQGLSEFDKVEVVVEEVKNGSVFRSWTLKDTIIDNKKDGVFYGPEQKLYYFKANDLNEDALYRLKIDIDNGNHIVKGQTKLVSKVTIKYPMPNHAFNFADNDVQKNGYKNVGINFTKSQNAAIYKMQLVIYYREYSSSGEEVKSHVMSLGELKANEIVTATPSIVAKGEHFFEYLSKKIEDKGDVEKRTLEALEIVLTIGSEDLQTYMLINEPTNSLAQNKPTFSNLDGALGIFSARQTVRQYMPVYISPNTRCLNQNSTKELCKGAYTSKYKFCSDIPLDNSTSFTCQ